jgi:nucleoside 2-deoxyribosyltransferase
VKRVYLAGPIKGLSYDGATDWRAIVGAMLRVRNIHSLSPMRYKFYLQNETNLDSTTYTHPLSTPKGLTTRDRNDVFTCDALIVNLLGAERVSVGTMIELGWADAKRKPIVVVMEPGGNLHDHPMVQELAGFRVPTLPEAVELVAAILDSEGSI